MPKAFPQGGKPYKPKTDSPLSGLSVYIYSTSIPQAPSARVKDFGFLYKMPVMAQLVHNVRRDVRQVVQAVPGGLQLAHDLHSGLIGFQHREPLVKAGLYLKHAVGVGGLLQHDLIGFLAGDDAAVQILPLLAAKDDVVGLLLGAAVHEVVHQKILGIKIDDNAAEIKNNILVHKNLPAGQCVLPLLYTPRGDRARQQFHFPGIE